MEVSTCTERTIPAMPNECHSKVILDKGDVISISSHFRVKYIFEFLSSIFFIEIPIFVVVL
jgi:hypothetical protein